MKKSTRNAHGSGTIRQRPDGRWEARYTTGRHPGTGKQIQKSVYGATQAEVRKKLSAATAAIDDGTFLEPSRLTVGGWLDIWLAEYTSNVKELTLTTYETQVRVHLKPALGAVKLTALTAPHIQKLYNTLSKGNEERAGLSPKTIQNINGVLHRALDQAIRLGYLRANPCAGVMLPRTEKPAIEPFNDEDMASFMKAIKGHPFETLFVVDLFTGLRQSELLGLTWGCVDFDAGMIVVDKQLIKEKKKGGAYKLAPPKNDKSRRLSPAPSIMKLLLEHKDRQQEAAARAGRAWNHSDLVFTNALGENLSHSTLAHTFKRIMRQIGLPDARFHDLRHSFAVAALRSGIDIKTVQESLGHHTASFTLDTYLHVTEKMHKDASDKMEAFMTSVSAL